MPVSVQKTTTYKLDEIDIKNALAKYLQDHEKAVGRKIEVKLDVAEHMEGYGNYEYPVRAFSAIVVFSED